ncbi:MAG: 16S rRNA (cytidine(1402)-2'-O)-methyltransferase [Myxococcota bacterium]
MAAVLKVIATPLGNVGDLAPRAQEALRSCSCLVAEDTRTAARLFAALTMSTREIRLLSCPAPREPDRVQDVLQALARGEVVGLISEAGAPCISDPGARLVGAVVDAGYPVQVLPGPSAPVAALMGAGLNTARFAFLGFLPRVAAKRRQVIEGAARAGLALVICEAAHRVPALLRELHAWCGSRRVVVARELTKRFETFHRGALGGPLVPPWREQGEAVVVVEAASVVAAACGLPAQELSEEDLIRQARGLLAQGLSARAVTARLHRQAPHVPKRRLYQLVLRVRKM